MKDRVGMKFSRLTVVAFHHKNHRGDVFYSCVCDCGTRKVVSYSSLLSGQTRSCRCLFRELHKQRFPNRVHRGSATYTSWKSMKQRCADPNSEHYRWYGARGIKVCQRWRRSFAAFLADMGERPAGKTIDRINNDLGYFKENCRWATNLEQQQNRRKRVCT